MRKIKIAPSILSADPARIGEVLSILDRCEEVDLLHIDIMDGHFVPNLTFGPHMVKAMRKYTKKEFYVHLMLTNPSIFIKPFADAGANLLSVHVECLENLNTLIEKIKSCGVKAGIAINPNTPAHVVEPYIQTVDEIVVMSVYPGFGGQKFIESVLPKISEVEKIVRKSGRDIDIAVDGGINASTAIPAVKNGANLLVSGNGIFVDGNPDIGKIRELRKIAEDAR
ncbi:MAG: ribulose-phosphate 3-epimerase [Thermoplasmata archaeon]